MAASDREAQRIHDAAEQLLAVDADLRTLSWTRVQDIANALSVKKLRGSERRMYARELQVIAATNLAVAARLDGSNERAAMQGIAEDAPVQQQEGRSDKRAFGSHPSSDADVLQSSHAEESEQASAVETTERLSSVPIDGTEVRPDGSTASDSQEHVVTGESDRSTVPEQTPDKNIQNNPGAGVDVAATTTPADPNFDDRGRWTGDTAPMNVVQMINAEMVFQSEDERDKDRYAAAAAQASLYDDPVSVVLPSAEELEAMLPTVSEMAAVEDEELKHEVAAEHRERERARLSDTDRTPVAVPGTPGEPGVGGAKPADPKPAEGEPSISFGVSEHSRTERAVLAEKERKEAKKARKRAKRAERRKKHKSAVEPTIEYDAEAIPVSDEPSESASTREEGRGVPHNTNDSAARRSPEDAPSSTEYTFARLRNDGRHDSDPSGAESLTEPSEPKVDTIKDRGVKSSPADTAAFDGAHDATIRSSTAESDDPQALDDQNAGRESSSHKSRRFKLFGRHHTEDLPVIPRGKSAYAPDDLFVIDKHRAARAASAQTSIVTDDSPSPVYEEKDPSEAEPSARHRPEHARSAAESESPASADENEDAR